MNRLQIINVGNTNTEVAVAENGVITSQFKMASCDFDISRIAQMPTSAASVLPKITGMLQEQIKDIFFLTPENCPKLNFSRCNARSIGMDRVANLCELAELKMLPAMTIDFGTAITFEALDENLCFQGGAILPGRFLARKALNNGTGQLPQVPLTVANFEFNTPAVETIEAIKLGVDFGLVGAVEKIINLMYSALGNDLTIYAVGGDRHFFMEYLNLFDGGDDFTLRGINYGKSWK